MGAGMDLTTDGVERVVVLDGELRLAQADQARRELLDALRPGQTTVADLAGVTEVDLAGLQLICSAHRTYRKRQACFRVRGMPDGMRRTAEAAGFEAHRSVCPYRTADSGCIWRS
jgi:anti-anti-sigma factor